MAAALFIVLEREVDFDPFVNGKTLSRMGERLESLALQLEVTPLLEFFSTDPAEVAAEFDLEPTQVNWSEQWFEADAGLATVRALLVHLENSPDEFPDQTITADLREFESVLIQASRRNVKWHLGIDS